MIRAGMNSANYRIIRTTEAYILLEDLGPWSQHPTITNDAEQVVEAVAVQLGNRRLLYYDSEGDLTELKHTNGKFTGFGFVKELP